MAPCLRRFSAPLFLALMLLGGPPALAGDVDGSLASPALQEAVTKKVVELEKAGDRWACAPRVMTARVVEPEEGGAWVERWSIRSCLEILPYTVTFTPDPQAEGGTAFEVELERSRYGHPTR